MMLNIIFLVLIFISANCSKGKMETSNVTSVRDTCENPDADISCCFVNMPERLNSVMKIATENETGKRMIIKGRISKEDGSPFSGIIVYAYHTDNSGIYPKKGNETGLQKWHGYLHGWCITDENGRYEIHSIKPGRYPSNNAPAHIHAALKFPDGTMTFVNDFVFTDDQFVNENYLSRLHYPGDNGVIELKMNDGILIGERQTTLDAGR